MKDLLTVITLLISINISWAQKDFRNATWGMNIEAVKASEEGEPSESSDSSLAYNDQAFVGFKGNFNYEFKHNQLVSGKYVSTERQTNKNIYISNFDKVKEALVKEHGEPKTDEKKWNDEKSPYKNTPTMWGHAISEGTLEFWVTWETANTTITLSLTGGNYQIHHVVEYKGNYEVEVPKSSGKSKKKKKK